jgi:hypothetical protein
MKRAGHFIPLLRVSISQRVGKGEGQVRDDAGGSQAVQNSGRVPGVDQYSM